MSLQRAKESREMSCSALNLLDEYWFFKTPFAPARRLPSDEKMRKELADDSRESHKKDNKIPTLFRMPTSPPTFQRSETAQSLNSCNPKFRHSLTSLDAYRSPTSSKYVKPQRSERYLAIQHYIAKEAYYRKIFKEKKWRSHSDLECIEVQGFKDLGFVFDKEELKASMEKIIPGLRQIDHSIDNKNITSPYLSESWRTQQSSSAPMFRCVDKRSGEVMKEQLRFWARAVACNARGEL